MRRIFMFTLLTLLALPGRGQEPVWSAPGADGLPELELYFFWSKACPHCTSAYLIITRLPEDRPWMRLHDLEISRSAEHATRCRQMARPLGQRAVSVPALLFCGEIHIGWESDETTGEFLRGRLDECRKGLIAAPASSVAAPADAR